MTICGMIKPRSVWCAAIIRMWNKSQPRLCLKLPLWLPTQKAFYRQGKITKNKWLTYCDILVFAQREIKTRSDNKRTFFSMFLMHIKVDK